MCVNCWYTCIYSMEDRVYNTLSKDPSSELKVETLDLVSNLVWVLIIFLKVCNYTSLSSNETPIKPWYIVFKFWALMVLMKIYLTCTLGESWSRVRVDLCKICSMKALKSTPCYMWLCLPPLQLLKLYFCYSVCSDIYVTWIYPARAAHTAIV